LLFLRTNKITHRRKETLPSSTTFNVYQSWNCDDLRPRGGFEKYSGTTPRLQELISPQEIEIFGLPDPKPEDRDYYWEFGTD
jgi:hypothetical protein